MTDAELGREILNLVVAGHETTASLISWMWFLLAAHPEAQTKLGQELDSGQCEEHPTIETFPDYVYTRQVIDEALRLYPPLWLMSRKAKEDDYLGEYFVPAGTEIYISPYFIQRNPQLWEAPDRFDPDRMSIGNKPDRPELAFCPFGGPRKCIGDFFARVEIQMHLMMMARCLRFGACETIRPEFATRLNLLSKQDFVMLPEMRTQAFITHAGDAAIAAPHKTAGEHRLRRDRALPSRRTRSLDRLRFAATTGVALALAAGGTADAAGSFDGTYRGAGRSPDPSQRRDRATPAIQLDHRQVLPATSDLQFRKGYTVRKRFFAAGLLLLMCGRLASAQSPNDHPPPPTADVIAVGDKLKLSFYEPLAADKWSEGRNGQPGPSFYLRAEFSGEYVVAPDWSVTVPVIGRVMAAHRTAEDVANDLTNPFDKLIGHAGSVTATIVSRLPIYVVGPVKTPGAYPFSPGLTPLSAVALAGGVLNQEPDRWALVEAMQMAGKHASSVERLQRVLAQYAVLRAELDGKPVTVPDQLVRLVGEQRARDLAATEAARRAPVLAAQADRAHGFQSAIDTAQQAISIDQSRLAPLQESINARQVRTDALLSLMKGGNSDRTVVLQAQSELVNVQDRRAEVLTSIAADQNRLANARIDAAKFASDTKAELEQKVTDLQREIDTLSPEVSADAGVMQLLQPSDPSSGDDLRFEIVRGSDVLSADITTRLDPGDVVRVMSLHPTAVGSTTDSRRGYIASRTGD